MLINFEALCRYDNGAMIPRILKEVISGKGKPGTGSSSDQPTMTYEDFIWFILSAEDKKSHQSIEYWFRCVDRDGDGIITISDLEYFYEEQIERMHLSRISDLWKFDDFVCALYDVELILEWI
jgi:serine/threonine-protein phosphatase 2A regulatory subunit B''